MASFNSSGIEGLLLSMEEVAELPEEVLLEMLSAEGEVIADAQRKKIRKLGLVDSGQLAASIAINKRMRVNGRLPGMERYITVYPKGTRKPKKRRKRDGVAESTRTVTNSEVAFVQEFGAPWRGISGKEWMRTANDEAADKATAAAEAVYDNWLKSKNL